MSRPSQRVKFNRRWHPLLRSNDGCVGTTWTMASTRPDRKREEPKSSSCAATSAQQHVRYAGLGPDRIQWFRHTPNADNSNPVGSQVSMD